MLPEGVSDAVGAWTGLEPWEPPPSGPFRPADMLVAVPTFYPIRDPAADTLEIEADWFFPSDGRARANGWLFRVTCEEGRCRVIDRARSGHAD